VKRFGDYSKPGEFVYDHPFQWGSRRIGPDLAREGGKQSDYWHLLHFRKPDNMTPGSIMPPYAYMERSELDFDSIPLRVKAMQRLGVPYTDAQYLAAKEDAKAQAGKIAANLVDQSKNEQLKDLRDKEVIAIIAYMQRIGTDYKKPAPTAAPAATPATQPAAVALGGTK
jgi:cytochrome c oxidase cbb3-type subunit I/II